MHLNRRKLFKFLGAGLLVQSCVPFTKEGTMLTNPEQIFSGFRVGNAYVSPAGLVISSPLTTQKVSFANEIHSIIHSRKLDLKIFVSKLELLSFAQFGNGPYVEIRPDEGNYFCSQKTPSVH